ncbi:hypothetical protein CAEBREN_19190 [Caenorhabditis brenneri]|uniref:Uncharacterized protein n=1 Tax=Caenorhabditis brenneri TaxID=135651 RepID=G0NDB2_CAEBE|nr:hypothetical protein CAEBREN_19190 [Caenorhabditis brenneri]
MTDPKQKRIDEFFKRNGKQCYLTNYEKSKANVFNYEYLRVN